MMMIIDQLTRWSRASAVEFARSLGRRGADLVIQAKVRSTTQRRGSTDELVQLGCA